MTETYRISADNRGEVEKGLAHLKNVDISWIQEVFGSAISFES